jgi:hypothetical protein
MVTGVSFAITAKTSSISGAESIIPEFGFWILGF